MIEAISPLISPIENIPQELTERPQWVCWRYEERDEKLTKIPYSTTGWRASSTDPTTWSTFDEALTAHKKRGYDGIGFVFSDDDPYCGIDLDKCRDPKTGEIAPWAQKIINRVDGTYVEASPSGTGIHIIVEGTVRGGGMRKGPVEMYSRVRFFTITGEVL
jgi:putative DNA primase/helicase